ncbi:hypothetical protein BH09ACT12_BH09ACT12_13430 [soil metagenome]
MASVSTVVPLHLGALHPVEQALTLALAFGPFLVLGIVIVLRRRADETEQPDQVGRTDPSDQAEDAEDAEDADQRDR